MQEIREKIEGLLREKLTVEVWMDNKRYRGLWSQVRGDWQQGCREAAAELAKLFESEQRTIVAGCQDYLDEKDKQIATAQAQAAVMAGVLTHCDAIFKELEKDGVYSEAFRETIQAALSPVSVLWSGVWDTKHEGSDVIELYNVIEYGESANVIVFTKCSEQGKQADEQGDGDE